jgi:hypothetical protein
MEDFKCFAKARAAGCRRWFQNHGKINVAMLRRTTPDGRPEEKRPTDSVAPRGVSQEPAGNRYRVIS